MFSLTIDTADGQTTSPQPPPFTLPTTLDQMSPCTSPSHILPSGPQTPDRSQPASAAGQCQDHPLPSSTTEDAGSITDLVCSHPLPDHNNSEVASVPSPETDVPPACAPAADMSRLLQHPEGEGLCRAAEGDSESAEVVNGSLLPHLEELSPLQPMDQETASLTTIIQPDSTEMEVPVSPGGEMSSNRDPAEGEHSSSSDNIPSLAAALIELHELLVSNNLAQNRSTSCSPPHLFTQDSEELAPEPCPPSPTPSTAINAGAESSDAKAKHAAVVSEGPSTCLVPDPSCHSEPLDIDTAETVGAGVPVESLQHPGAPGEERADRCGQGEATQPEPEGSPDPVGDLDFQEPPEGHQGRGVADGHTCEPDLLTEHTVVRPSSPEDVSDASPSSVPPPAQAAQPPSAAPLLPSPRPFIEQFPAEHIQRIQAAGFSAREAAEALEQAHGVVELALLALLARSITVPP